VTDGYFWQSLLPSSKTGHNKAASAPEVQELKSDRSASHGWYKAWNISWGEGWYSDTRTPTAISRIYTRFPVFLPHPTANGQRVWQGSIKFPAAANTAGHKEWYCLGKAQLHHSAETEGHLSELPDYTCWKTHRKPPEIR
jgi:hypothetical protein